MVKHLKENENLEELVKEGIHIVDFYAEWCGPCQMLGPVLESLDNVDVIKIDTDIHESLAQSFGIMSVPTLLFYKDGTIIRKEIGFKPKEEIEKIIASL